MKSQWINSKQERSLNLPTIKRLFYFRPLRSAQRKVILLPKKVHHELQELMTVALMQIHNKSPEEILLYMRASDLLLVTSTSEGSNNTLKEAILNDLPTVCFDVGDCKKSQW